MVALVAPRNTPQAIGEFRVVPIAANTRIWAGGMVQITAANLADRATATAANICIGRAEETVDNTGGAAGALNVKVRRGLFRYTNSTAGDLIVRSDIGKTVFVVDDDQVAKTNNAGARPAAGICFDVDAQGVWVQLG